MHFFLLWVGILVLFLVLLVINFCLLPPGDQTGSFPGNHDTSLLEVVARPGKSLAQI